jgi:hypothetical protein
VRAAETPDVPEAVTETQVILYSPSMRETGGRCGTSVALTRRGAWRCTSPRAPSVDRASETWAQLR